MKKNENNMNKEGVKMLEKRVGAKINDILGTLNEPWFAPNAREIIKLRYGIKNGKMYTLEETANILKEMQKASEESKEFEDDKKYIYEHCGIIISRDVWNMETVRQSESRSLRKLEYYFSNNVVK